MASLSLFLQVEVCRQVMSAGERSGGRQAQSNSWCKHIWMFPAFMLKSISWNCWRLNGSVSGLHRTVDIKNTVLGVISNSCKGELKGIMNISHQTCYLLWMIDVLTVSHSLTPSKPWQVTSANEQHCTLSSHLPKKIILTAKLVPYYQKRHYTKKKLFPGVTF